jgi:hypothetical protein
MSENARQRELTRPRARSEGARVTAQRYWRARQQARSGEGLSAGRPRPLEFDESGFPIAQRRASFAERVARLLG